MFFNSIYGNNLSNVGILTGHEKIPAACFVLKRILKLGKNTTLPREKSLLFIISFC